MKVTIWDMDFYNKKSFLPNPTLMKISSFHKQQGHVVNFVEEKHHLSMAYDIFYIMRKKRKTPRPSSKLIDDNRVRLLGESFKPFDNYWEIDAVIAAVRPDYMLYPDDDKHNPYYNASFVQFYHDGKLLTMKQPFENTKKYHKKTVVIDEDFWEHSDENVILCLTELTTYKNVAFLAPIKLKKIIDSEEIRKCFLKIIFSKGTIFKFQNNIGSSYKNASTMFDFIEDLKEVNEKCKLGSVPIRIVSSNHWEDKQNAVDDLERCLKIMSEAKRRKIHIILVSPTREDFETPYWYYFEILQSWSINFYDKSYIELMLYSSVSRFNLPWYAILNDSMKWSLPNANHLLAVITQKREWIEKYGYVQWGEKELEKELINWKEIEKFTGGEIID